MNSHQCMCEELLSWFVAEGVSSEVTHRVTHLLSCLAYYKQQFAVQLHSRDVP